MEARLNSVLGLGQVKLFIPELVKLCKEKNISMNNYSLVHKGFFQLELKTILEGSESSLSYALGWIDGYEKSHKINQKQPDYKSKKLFSTMNARGLNDEHRKYAQTR